MPNTLQPTPDPLLGTVIDHVPSLIFWKDAQLRYRGFNRYFAERIGKDKAEEIIGKTDAELAWPDEEHELFSLHDEVVAKDKSPALGDTSLFISRDGMPAWIETNKIPLFDHSGALIGILGSYLDVTDRKHHEEEQENNSRLNARLVNLAARINLEAERGIHEQLADLSHAITEELGIPRVSLWSYDAMRHTLCCEIAIAGDHRSIDTQTELDLSDIPWFYTSLEKNIVLSSHDAFSHPLFSSLIETYLIPHDISSFMVCPIIMPGSVWGALFVETEGQMHIWNPQEEHFVHSLANIMATSISVFENRKITRELRQKNDFFDLLLDATRDGIWDWNLRDNTAFYSPTLKNMLGYKEHEFKNETGELTRLIHPEDQPVVLQEIRRHLKRETEIYEASFRVRMKNGNYKWILSRGRALFEESGRAFHMVGAHADVDQLVRTQEQLSQQNQLMDKIIENLPVGLFAKDVKNDYVYSIWNRRLEEIFGTERDSVLGRNDHAMFTREEADYRRMTDSQVLEYDAPVEIYENVRKGDDLIRMHIKKFPLFDRHQQPEMIVGIIEDITEWVQNQRELHAHRNDLEALIIEQTQDIIAAKEEAEKANQAKSEFLANMSHELRTPMHAIINYSQMGLDKTDPQADDKSERIYKYFNNIQRSGKRLLALLNDLLDLSKMEAGRMEFFFATHAIDDCVNHAFEELQSLAQTKNIALSLVQNTTNNKAWTDRNRIIQVIVNLLSNALKFTGEGKRITVTLKDTELSTAGNTVPGLAVMVSDQGIGIPEGELEEVFGKFSQSTRTKTGAGGTGLGLSICRQIISSHGGEIWVQNNPEGGACFTFVIPRENPLAARENHSGLT